MNVHQRSPLAKAGGFTAAVLAAAAAGYAVRRISTVLAVAPQLRDLSLLVEMPGARDAMLPTFRGGVKATKVRSGVDMTTAAARHQGLEVPFVRYEPRGRVRPTGALVWIHGGGTVAGKPGMDHDLCSMIAAELGILVLSVDYRLAPEHPFPAPLDDCAAVLAWLHEHADQEGVDPARIAVGGASAGGGLAASLAQRAHDEGVPVAFQLLVYPMIDDRTVLRRVPGPRGRLAWTPGLNRYGWTSYLGRAPREADAPAYAAASRRGDLSGLAPAWIGVGDLDLFLDEDLEYAARLRCAGVDAELHVVRRMQHGADGTHPQAPAMLDFRNRMVRALRPHV